MDNATKQAALVKVASPMRCPVLTYVTVASPMQCPVPMRCLVHSPMQWCVLTYVTVAPPLRSSANSIDFNIGSEISPPSLLDDYPVNPNSYFDNSMMAYHRKLIYRLSKVLSSALAVSFNDV
eukprot:3941503-Rhodomonas_salina.3